MRRLDSGGEPLSIRIKVVQGSMGEGWQIPCSRWAWRFDPAQSGGGRVILDYSYRLFSIAMWLLGEVEKVYAWITYRPIRPELADPGVPLVRGVDHVVGADGDAVAVRSEYDILVRSKYTPEDEWLELMGSRGFIWANGCTSRLLDRAPVVMYRDGVTTEFSNMDSDWAASFVAGVHDFADAILQDRQAPLTGEEGKVMLQFCRAIHLSANEGREVRPEEIR